MLNRIVQRLSVGLTGISLIMLVLFMFFQLTMADTVSYVGWLDTNLTALETKYLLVESDISLFRGVSSLEVLKRKKGYVDTPEQVIYLELEHAQIQAANIP